MGLLISLLIAAAIIFLNVVTRTIRDRKIQKNAEEILNNKFNGNDTATYRVDGKAGLKFEQVLLGAEKRGYILHARNQDTKRITTLVFKKTGTQ